MSKRNREETYSPSSSHVTLQESEQGHWYGNFHNYYNFHPVAERCRILSQPKGFLDTIASAALDQNRLQRNVELSYRYTDIGCNQGCLTIEVAKALHERLLRNHGKVSFEAIGIDLDTALIKRANSIASLSDKDLSSSRPTIQFSFRAGDVLEDESVLVQTDITSIFSTTMWIHMHGGDEGLKRVLKRVCATSKHFILIESQPSRCYRAAKMRQRRMNLTEMDVSPQRLTMRLNIEEEIENILKIDGFDRVKDDGMTTVDSNTSWNRKLRLYARR